MLVVGQMSFVGGIHSEFGIVPLDLEPARMRHSCRHAFILPEVDFCAATSGKREKRVVCFSFKRHSWSRSIFKRAKPHGGLAQVCPSWPWRITLTSQIHTFLKIVKGPNGKRKKGNDGILIICLSDIDNFGLRGRPGLIYSAIFQRSPSWCLDQILHGYHTLPTVQFRPYSVRSRC